MTPRTGRRRSRGSASAALAGAVLVLSASAVATHGSAPAAAVAAPVVASASGVALPAPGRPTEEPVPSAEELGLQVEAGYDRQVAAGSWLPVAVRVQPDRPLRGTVTVHSRAGGAALRHDRSVEAAAGVAKVYRFLVPAGPVTVSLAEDGRESLDVRADVRRDRRTFLVGVLGQMPDEPPALRSEPTGMAGRWVRLDPAWLALSPLALEPLAAVVADGSDLEGLDAAARRNLAAAVSAGTDLVVVADRAGPLRAVHPLPALAVNAVPAGGAAAFRALEPQDDAWALAATAIREDAGPGVLAAAAPVGRGRVVVSGVGPGEGPLGSSGRLWSLLAGPGGRVGGEVGGWRHEGRAHLLGRILEGTDAPATAALPWLAVFTIAYVVVVGPVNSLLLARLGRRELAWVTVPVVTAVFTVGAFVGVSGARPSTGVAAAATVWLDGAATELVTVGARAPTEGRRTIELGDGSWVVDPVVDGGREVVVGDDGRVEVDLTALQLGGLTAWRSADAEPPMTVDAATTADGVEVTVTNSGREPLTGVVVRAATASRTVGTLAPGASQTVGVGGQHLPGADPHASPLDRLGSRPPATVEALLRAGVIDGNPGLVWAVGSQASIGRSPRVDGTAADDRGRLVAVGVRPRPADRVVSPFAVARTAVAGEHAQQPSPLAIEGEHEAFLRFRLPPAGGLEALRSDLRRGGGGFAELFVWEPAARRWLPLEEAFPGGVGEPDRLVGPLGEVWVRATGDLLPFDFSARSLSATLAQEPR